MNYKNKTQSFSSIDTRKDINNPGIVYPLSKSDAEMINVSSIVDHKTNKRTEIAHSEIRLFKNNENKLEYQKGRHTSIVIDDEKYFTFNDIPVGWTSVIASIFLTSGIIMVCLGGVGIYIGNIFKQTRGMPEYIVEEIINGK